MKHVTSKHMLLLLLPGLHPYHLRIVTRYDFDIPILALDLVAAGGSVSLAIVDTCPVTSRLTLPQHYVETILELQDNFLPGTPRGGNSVIRCTYCVLYGCAMPWEL